MSADRPLFHERNLILASLFILAVAAWAVLLSQSRMAGSQAMGLRMGMDASLFMAIWVVMMVAMMFPTVAPMILIFARVHTGRRQRGHSFVPTWVFVGAYLLIWTVFGLLAYTMAVGAEVIQQRSMWLTGNAPRISGAILLLSGLYQLSPLKATCLSKCRTPLAFLLSSWRDGYAGAIRMGLEHGLYCLGCCWLLFVALFSLGVMNVAVMAAITLLIFAEKSFPAGRRIAHVAAFALLAYGALVIFVPNALPTMV